MKKNMKRLFGTVVLATFLMAQPLCSVTVFADLLHNERDVQVLTDGVVYEKSSRLYSAGWMDVYALSIDVKNSNVGFDVIQSTGEMGIKQNVETLAKTNNVIAAVNGDFFGAGNPRSSMGQVVKDGGLAQGQNYYNVADNTYAGVFLDKSMTPFIDYLHTQMSFYNAPTPVIEMLAKNKVGDYSKPIYFDRTAIQNTADIDKRTPDLSKIVVTDKVITYISAPGETVDVPENGYIIVLNKKTAADKLSSFSVGQKVDFSESEKFLFRPDKDISEILTGISGGGEILQNGKPVKSGLVIGANARNPRTCIGVNKDKTKIIIVAVDGRTNGIGATHDDMAGLMLEYGAYDAIHLDGGGSTTMALREQGQTDVKVVNVPSEGAQRAVANGIGIRTTNETGALHKLYLKIKNHSDNRVLATTPFEVTVTGVDQFENPVPVDMSQVQFYVDGVNGERMGNSFICSAEGVGKIVASVGENITAETTVTVLPQPTAITATADSYALDNGESTHLSVSMLNKDGYNGDVNDSDVVWTIDNPNVGTIDGATFTGKESGVANLTATYKGLTSTIMVAVGKTTYYVSSFESDLKMSFKNYPEDAKIAGSVARATNEHLDGASSIGLTYKFLDNQTNTQAGYIAFDDAPILLGTNMTDIAMWAKGDNSGNILKATIIDASKKEYAVVLSDKIDYADWKYVTAKLPTNMQYPVSLKRIYVAALQTGGAQKLSTVYIDNLTSLAPIPTPALANAVFADYRHVNLSTAPESGFQDFTVFGKTANKDYKTANDVQTAAIQKMQQNARAMMFAGFSDVPNPTQVVSLKWNNQYERNGIENMAIYSIGTNSGGIRTTDYNQWTYIQQDLYNCPKNNILLVMNKDIWGRGSNGFSDRKEAKLLHKILKEFTETTGKNVMVVAATGYNTNVAVKDNVRYITLNGLSAKNVNDLSNFTYLRIRASQTGMYYDILPVYSK